MAKSCWLRVKCVNHVFALTLTFEAIEFENGKILNGRMSQYRVPRFNDLPIVETVLLDRKDIPSAGAGECPMIGLAPAIANAIFQATGVRLRSLPLIPTGQKVS